MDGKCSQSGFSALDTYLDTNPPINLPIGGGLPLYLNTYLSPSTRRWSFSLAAFGGDGGLRRLRAGPAMPDINEQ